jgi:Uma2 family endonuclease
MSMPQTEAPIQYTPEDLLALPDAVRFELVDGKLVERPMGFFSSFVGGRLFFLLTAHCDAHGLGWVLPSDASYQCFPNAPTKVRKPDVSFVDASRLPANQAPQGHAHLPPDLAVEVISPNEIFGDAIRKAGEYLEAGVRLVWLIEPTTRTALVFRQDGSGAILRGGELSGEDVVRGFRCSLDELFRPPQGTETT